MQKLNEQVEDSWMQNMWRPFMAFSYGLVCICDFIIFPAYNMVVLKNASPWVPLTLQMNGFYHLAMGAIVGVTSYKRSEEKIQRMIQGTDTPDNSDTTTNTTIKTVETATMTRPPNVTSN